MKPADEKEGIPTTSVGAMGVTSESKGHGTCAKVSFPIALDTISKVEAPTKVRGRTSPTTTVAPIKLTEETSTLVPKSVESESTSKRPTAVSTLKMGPLTDSSLSGKAAAGTSKPKESTEHTPSSISHIVQHSTDPNYSLVQKPQTKTEDTYSVKDNNNMSKDKIMEESSSVKLEVKLKPIFMGQTSQETSLNPPPSTVEKPIASAAVTSRISLPDVSVTEGPIASTVTCLERSQPLLTYSERSMPLPLSFTERPPPISTFSEKPPPVLTSGREPATSSFSVRSLPTSSFSERAPHSTSFISRPPPLSAAYIPPKDFLPVNTSALQRRFHQQSGDYQVSFCMAASGKPFNVPPRRSLISEVGQSSPSGPPPYSATNGATPARAFLVPVHSVGGPIVSLIPETQTRSYSIPRGPPPPLNLGVSRTHSWPTGSGLAMGAFRPPIPPDSPIAFNAPPFQGLRPRGGRQQQTLRISKWVNPIPPDPDDGQQQTGEQELATKMLQIQSKRFYIDVKQNRRGRFMKVAEIGADGRRNQVFLALSTAAEFRDHLTNFSEFYSNLGPPNPDTLPEDGKLKSETMVKDNRRYYLDLKENSRGRFLRVSQTIARGGPRCQIAIPAQGMIEFRDALQELLEEFGTDDGGYKGELPEGRHMRVENKNFYFDIGQNNRGIYMRISEVKTNFRTAITIPEKSWSRFRDIFADYVDKMKEGGEKSSSESNK